MSYSWTRIPATDAVRHPLYGVKNWLIVFALGILLGLIRELGTLKAEAHGAGMTLSDFLSIEHPAVTYIKVVLGLNIAIVAVIYWALFTKHPSFRVIASSLLLASWPIAALLGLVIPFEGLGATLGLSFFPWAISCSVWVTYLQRSRRVRVTFEYLVRSDELATQPHPQSPLPSPTSYNEGPTVSSKGQPKLENVEHQTSISAPSVSQQMPTMNDSAANVTEEDLWALALEELDGSQRKSGLWARCFASSNGVDAAARAMYLRERVIQLQSEESIRKAKILEHATTVANQQLEALTSLKTNYLNGKRPSAQDVRQLVLAAESDSTIVGLWDRFQGDTLLHWCARYDLATEAERLLALGADPCATNGKAQRPCMLAPSRDLREFLLAAASKSET